MSTNKKNASKAFKITFWGTRGTRSLTTPSCFGNNTICVEVQCGDRVLVFDAGSGFVNFGNDLIKRNTIKSFDLFFSHAHYDHVEGIPYFQPFYESEYKCNVWSGKLKGIENSREIFNFLMMEPYFPISIEKFHADIKFHDVEDKQEFDLGDGIYLNTIPLDHPGGATGYRVEYMGKSFCFVTDTTHILNETNQQIVSFIKDADMFVYDCGYSDEEFPKFASYGHSTWQEALRLKKLANAKNVLGFHHMPFRTDDELEQIDKEMRKSGPLSQIVREGAIFHL